MATKSTKPKFHPIDLGLLPHENISSVLDIEILAGSVHFSIPAQKHAFSRHPDTFHLCLPYLAQAVANPTYAGQAPDHLNDGFELVLSIPSNGLNILLAITLRPCNAGIYRVKSIYPIDSNKLSRRLRKRFLQKLEL